MVYRYVTHQNKLLLVTNEDAGSHSLAQLNKYGVFSKVDILDDTQTYSAYFISLDAVKTNEVKAALSQLSPKTRWNALRADTPDNGLLKRSRANTASPILPILAAKELLFF